MLESVVPMIGGQVDVRECGSNDRSPSRCWRVSGQLSAAKSMLECDSNNRRPGECPPNDRQPPPPLPSQNIEV